VTDGYDHVMPDPLEVLGHIRSNAELILKHFGPVSGVPDFGYNGPSVKWVEGYIEAQRVRTDLPPESRARLIDVIGSFLGQAIVHTYGGDWANDGSEWAIAFDDRNAAFPFVKVQKQFDNGIEDSIYAFFTAIPGVFKR